MNLYWVQQGLKEYELIYGKSVEEELAERGIADGSQFDKIVKEQIRKTTFHFGHPYLNSATMAGVFRISLKMWDKAH
jgi:hypothetical protein